MIYDLVYLAMVLAWVATSASQPLSRATLGGMCVLLFVFIGFRFVVGCDWSGYINIFDLTAHAKIADAREYVEPAYALMFVGIHTFGFDYPVINVLSAAIYVPCLYLFCRRLPDPLAGLILFFPVATIQLAMSGIRQASGLALLMLAFNAFMDRKVIAYFVWVVLASMFHSSALIFLPYAICVGRRVPLALALAVPLASAAAIPFVGAAGYELYQSRYIDTQMAANGAPLRVGLVAVAGVVFWFHARQWKDSEAPDYEWLSLMAGAMVACLPLAFLFPVVGDRVAYYLIPAQVTIFTRVPLLYNQGSGRIVASILPLLLMGGFLISWFQVSDLAQQCWVPYRSWFLDGLI